MRRMLRTDCAGTESLVDIIGGDPGGRNSLELVFDVRHGE